MKAEPFKYGSVSSGIEAATMAWHPLGWEPQWFSEIEPFPKAVLKHHYPNVPDLGDMTQIHKTYEFQESTINLLVGGTPCQSFSVAGLRKGMDDPRGNLALTFLAIAEKARPEWVVWENVPGVLSSNGGRDFGAILGGFKNSGMGGPTESWTLNTLERPKHAAACSLSQILEVGNVPARYYLSAKASQGIIRRASKRGKKLPPLLRQVLETIARE